jgi:Cu(I)/Ag(I) efflux system membrane fusion protein
LVLGGCGSPSNPASPPTAAAGAKAVEKSAVPGADVVAQDALPAGLAELSAADRAAALAQRVCPVSGERLGSMGKPFKVTVKGKTFFLCCDGCQEELNKDPDKYLAKLKK